ncbi:MAG: DUF1638 domain-containing protein [Eggerthellaceae bacterium]|nr:DUF1638 domain-containing protein [Eggerthellaceae bacterium]
MRYKLLACKIFEREIASVVANCPNNIDVTTIRQRLHDYPSNLRQQLQDEIDQIDNNTHRQTDDAHYTPFDAILLGYGLCGKCTIGLKSAKYPLVIPRTHDCIALLLGSRERFAELVPKSAGVFFFSPSFSSGYAKRMTNGEDEFDMCRYLFYLERYKGNEKRALKAVKLEQSLTSAYHSCAYIKWPTIDLPQHEEDVRELAKARGWKHLEIPGDDTLFRKLVDTDWLDPANVNDPDFLVVPPGHAIGESYDGSIFCAEDPAREGE